MDETESCCLRDFRSQIDEMKNPRNCNVSETLLDLVTMVEKAWEVDEELGQLMSGELRTSGGLDHLLTSWENGETVIDLSLRLLEVTSTPDNVDYVVRRGLDSVVELSTRSQSSGVGVLASLLGHSEEVCSQLLRKGVLQTVVDACTSSDERVAADCARAFANARLFGGRPALQEMADSLGFVWLFSLASHDNALTRYFAALAIAVFSLDAFGRELVTKSGVLPSLELVISDFDPQAVALNRQFSNCAHKSWLSLFLPALGCDIERVRRLASFHFAAATAFLQRRGMLRIIREIGAVEFLKEIALLRDDIGSFYASQVLVTIGDYSQDVPL